MNIAAIADYIAAMPEFSGRVGIAADLQNALDVIGTMHFPAAILYAPRENAVNTVTTAGNRAEVFSTIGIIIAVEYAGELGAANVFAELQLVRNPVQSALMNFIPDGDDVPLEFVGGRLAYSSTGFMLWVDEYRNSYRLNLNLS